MKKQEIQKKKNENKKLARKLQKRLQDEFDKVLNNPTESNVKKFKDFEVALLSLWLKVTYENISTSIDEAVKDGRSTAIEQLRNKGFSKEKDNQDLYKRIKKAKKYQVKADLEKVVASIIQNSNRNIDRVIDALIYQKKSIGEDFFASLKNFGLAYLTTKNNARYKLEDYIAMETQTSIVSAERQALFVKSLEYENDLVKVVHTTDEEPCELCQPFQDKTLSISGRTKGYMSVSEAESYGLNHVNCLDIYELAPEKPQSDIELQERNMKYHDRYFR